MFGNNPKRPPVTHNGMHLEIQHIFATLQGEGIYAGWPAIFIRLGGCNLACHFCDTEFESYHSESLTNIQATIAQLNPSGQIGLIVITGGEPLRQPIAPLCQLLIDAGYRVQLETNGTLYQPLPSSVDIICSPKPTATGYHHIRPDLLPHITAFKFIISATAPHYQDIGDVGQHTHSTPVYVQPMDEYDPPKNAANLRHAVTLALTHGYRVSLQTHKLMGVA